MFSGSIVALATPFDENDEIDFAAFEMLVQWHIEAKTDAIALGGSTGEGPCLTEGEQGELIRRAYALTQGKIPLIAGAGSASTRDAVRLSEQAQRYGADACLVIVPYCNRPTWQGCYKHYEAVSRVGIPFIVYHHPSRTMVRLPVSALAEILSLPHVVAVKEASADLAYTSELMRLSDVPVLCGDDILLLPLMALGARGVISIVANLIPKEWKALCALLLQGDFEQARGRFFQYQELVEAMTLEINPQCVKYALSLLHKCAPRMRLPLMEPQEQTREKIAQALQVMSQMSISGV